MAAALDKIPGGRFAGITTFPALLFDAASRTVKPTPNLETLRQASEALARDGYREIEINAPGTTSSVTLEALAEAGATQVEPGHGLTGTTPLHVSDDLPEAPAVVYLTEVSHLSGGEAFCFGGGLYIDPVFPNYQVKAIVAREPRTDDAALRAVEIPPPDAIDYYGMIDAGSDEARAWRQRCLWIPTSGLRHAGVRCWRLRTFDGKTCRRVDLPQLRREGPVAAAAIAAYRHQSRRRRSPPKAEVIDHGASYRARTIRAEPALAEVRHNIIGGLPTPSTKPAVASAFAAALAAKAEDIGARFAYGTNIEGLDIESGRVGGL